MAVNGITKRRTTLVGGTVTEVDFTGHTLKKLGLAIVGTAGRLAYKVNSAMVDIDDESANILDASAFINAVTIDKTGITSPTSPYRINKLYLVADSNIEVEWELMV